jgi:outer membrane immunogenic protein
MASMTRIRGQIMKFRVLTAATLVTLAALGSAGAADLGVAPVYRALPPPAPVYNWTGCYVGGGGGYAFWQQDSFLTLGGTAVTPSVSNGGKGWFGQGQFGCDYQFTAPLFGMQTVIGAFGDYEAGSITGSSTIPTPLVGLTGSEKESSTWAVGGRAGVLVTPRFLTYFDGGYTQARFDGVNYNFAIAGAAVGSGVSLAAQTYNGWFIGSGFEYAFDWIGISGLFIKTEFRYSQYGGNGVNVPLTPAPAGGAALNSQKATEFVSTELVYRFNWFR